MKKKIGTALFALGFLLLLSLAWIFRPYEKPDMTEVIPELKEMKAPFKEIDSVYYLDGGTVGIQLTDQRDQVISFSLPAPLGEQDRYQRLFKGALHYAEAGSQEIENPHATKVRLAEILRSNSKLGHEADIALACMTGRVRDYVTIFYRLHIANSYVDELSSVE